MQQQISCVTLGVTDIVFYQMNGLMLGTWLLKELAGDMKRKLMTPGAFSIAHNVAKQEDVQPVLDRLARYGGRILLDASAPPHGGMRGYVADPDEHSWEIAWNPQWPISPEGYVTWS